MAYYRNPDYLWSRYVIESFEKDDMKTFEKAISSTMFDIRAVVEGGFFGTAYSIGEYAFFSENQFITQKHHIMQQQKQSIENSAHLLLSENDMKKIESDAEKVSRYGINSFQSIVPSDSILILGIRKGSLNICKYMLEYVASASFNRKNIVMPTPGPDENSLNKSYLVLFIINQKSESYIDILKAKVIEIITVIKEIEMEVPKLTQKQAQYKLNEEKGYGYDNNKNAKLFTESMASTALINGLYQPSNSMISSLPSTSRVATRRSDRMNRMSATNMSTMSLFPPIQQNNNNNGSRTSSIIIPNSNQNYINFNNKNSNKDVEDIHSSFNYQMDIYKIKKSLILYLQNLSDLIDFISFLIDLYLPFISQQLSLKIDKMTQVNNDKVTTNTSSSSPSQLLPEIYNKVNNNNSNTNINTIVADEDSIEFLCLIKEKNYEYFQVSIF